MQASAIADISTFGRFISGKIIPVSIPYKLVAKLGGYQAIGPIILNFNKPVNDLSRGTTADEIVLCMAITTLQAL